MLAGAPGDPRSLSEGDEFVAPNLRGYGRSHGIRRAALLLLTLPTVEPDRRTCIASSTSKFQEPRHSAGRALL